jgi:Ribonuclease G/E
LTKYNGPGSIKSIIDENLKNDESTSKQIKKNFKKNKPILMVEERHLPKKSTKDKIKSFFKNNTVGLFKGKSNITKDIVEYKDQKEQETDLIKKQKDKYKVEYEKKKLDELPKKQDLKIKDNKIEERITPPLLRDSESDTESDSESDSESNSNSNRYKVY